MTAPARFRGTDLDGLLASRLRRSLVGSTLEHRVATLVFDAGHSQWTVDLDRGRSRVRRGAAEHPTLVVRGAPDVLSAVIGGDASGVQAFLDGDVTIRGDLGLSLELDGMLSDDEDAVHLVRARRATVMGVSTALVAGVASFALMAGVMNLAGYVAVGHHHAHGDVFTIISIHCCASPWSPGPPQYLRSRYIATIPQHRFIRSRRRSCQTTCC